MNRIPGSDEEDDIESLRLAALQSLKRKESFSERCALNSDSSHFRGKGSRNKWGRYGSHQRPGKTGHFNRHRNTNLIPIMPISAETEKNTNLPKVESSESINKENTSKEVGCSKFSRYNKSESESEGDETTSDENQLGTLKKSDSLEALMQELDEEIKGKQIDGETLTIKEFTKNEKIDQGSSDVEAQVEPLNKEVEPTKEEEKAPADIKCIAEDSSSIKVDTGNNKFEKKNIFPRKHFRSKSPNSRFFHKKRRMYPIPNMSSPPHHMPFNFNPNPFGPPIMPFMNPPQHNPMFMQTHVSQPPPLYFERPVSPLSINTESLTTATMAPLSPRSARFVLENKAIIERRKRSPRRSYSRSPSRSLSRSPRYSPSPPRRFRRSVSPRRLSRSPRCFSPRKRSLSPLRRRSPSPKRENPPISQQTKPQNKPKPKTEKVEENKPKETDVPKVEEEKILDPILLARKKKFESNEIKKKEGIIRLKPKDDKLAESKSETTTKSAVSKSETLTSLTNESQKPNENKTSTKLPSKGKPKTKTEQPKSKNETPKGKTEEAKAKTKEPKVKGDPKATEDPLEFQELERLLLNEDAPLDELDVQHKVVDIFSDEESDSDNEGRFKMKEKSATIPVLSFSKLVNGVKQEIKSEPLPDSSGARHGRDRDRDRRRRSPPTKPKPPETRQGHKKERIQPTSTESQIKRQKITFKSDPMPSIENRTDNKIEIKIKNPSKYEKTEKVKSKAEPVVEKSKIIHINEDDDDDDDVEALIDEEEEIILENDSGDEENAVLTEGDLRTQLSRKRAEKLYKIPAEEVSTRILKFALQGAVFKKPKKKSKKKSSSEAKLPIHLRLGLNSTKDIFEDIKVKKKSKKRKAREVLEQKAPSKYMKNLQLE